MENFGVTCSSFYSVPCEDITGFPQNLLILQIWKKSLAGSQLNFTVPSCRCTGRGKPCFGKKVPKIGMTYSIRRQYFKNLSWLLTSSLGQRHPCTVLHSQCSLLNASLLKQKGRGRWPTPLEKAFLLFYFSLLINFFLQC